MTLFIISLWTGIPLILFAAFVIGCRKLGQAGVREYQLAETHDPAAHPRCACYYTSAMGLSEPRFIRGRICEMYYLNYGKWPEWCRGPET